MQRVFIVHGWGGFPEEGWFPWLKAELEKKNIKVAVLKMPHSSHPKIQEWVSFLAKTVKKPDENMYFVGHSIGCQTIMRYLEKTKVPVGGVVFVAGWFNLTREAILVGPEDEKIAHPWLTTPIDCPAVKKNAKSIVAIFSDNDPFVPLSDAQLFQKRLHAKVVILKNKKHFSGEDNVEKLPEVLNELETMMKN